MARRKPAKKEVSEPEQTLTTVARLVNITDQAALVLGILGYAATKVYNVANHHRRDTWQAAGKIPGFADQCRELKTNCWYKLLPSQTSQEILGELDDSYRSWYSHRKNGNQKARPPGFRRKVTLSTLTFKQTAFEILGENKVRLKLPRTYNRKELVLEYRLPPNTAELGKVAQVKVIYDQESGSWYLHITHKVRVAFRKPVISWPWTWVSSISPPGTSQTAALL
jgi:putative transposase